MTFDRTQQPFQQNPERFAERSVAHHASLRMSDEAHRQLDFSPRLERQSAQFESNFAPRRDGRTHDIVHSASEGVGHKLWARTKFAHVVQNGNLGCAASVSECLQRAGFHYANDAGVGGLVDKLMKNGWTKHPINEAFAGDVIYGHKGGGWRNGGGNAHIGIMGEKGKGFANSSGSGLWKAGPLEGIIGSRRFGQNRFCLRPPGGGLELEGPPDQQLDGRSSALDKLTAVQQLSHQGMSSFRFQGQDGQTYSLRTETESVGKREMVHLFITMPDGKERVVLRGIAQGDGSFEKEKSSSGRSVDFCGSGASSVYGGDSFSRPAREHDSFDGQMDNDGAMVRRSNNSQYEGYRREQDRIERERPFIPLGDSPLFSNSSGDALNKIMDDAQTAANNGVNQLIRTPQGVYMRARMDIDADGSTRARQIDPTGQTQTSMRYADGSSVNAEAVPYMVLPGGQYAQFGIKLGDMCLVRNKENGKVTVAVFADVGPRHKRGEGSMALAGELGINSSPTRGGISQPNIEYLVLPGSGYPVQNQQQLLTRIKAQRERLGLR